MRRAHDVQSSISLSRGRQHGPFSFVSVRRWVKIYWDARGVTLKEKAIGKEKRRIFILLLL